MPLILSVISQGSLVSDPARLELMTPPIVNNWIAAFSVFIDLSLKVPSFSPTQTLKTWRHAGG